MVTKRKFFHALAFMLFVFGIFFISGEAVHAENITEGNLKYQLDADNQTAKVIGLADALKDNNPAEITIPASVTYSGKAYIVKSIGSNAFESNTFKKVNFEKNINLETISEKAFYMCASLSEITIPASVTNMGAYAFANTGLEKVTFEEKSKLQTLSQRVFIACKKIETITIPASVTTIETGALSNTTLKTVEFEPGSKLKSIGQMVFLNDNYLTEITIPAGVTSIGERAFDLSTNLKYIYYTGSNWDAIQKDGAEITSAAKVYICKYINDATANLSTSSLTYNREVQVPEIQSVLDGTTKLTENTHYKLVLNVKNPTDVGQYKVFVTGIGVNGYIGRIPLDYTILPKNITASDITIDIEKCVYDPNKIKNPTVTVTDGTAALEKDTDYQVTYTELSPGTEKITVEGIGNYTGASEQNYKFQPKDIEAESVKISVEDCEFDRTEKTPAVIVTDGATTLKEGRDYNLQYNDNIEIGTGKVSVQGEGNYTGSSISSFQIKPRKITADGIKIQVENCVYGGLSQKPTVIIKDRTVILKKDIDYTLSYSNNIKAGTAKVSIVGKGLYTGTISKNFTISKARNRLALKGKKVKVEAKKLKKKAVTIPGFKCYNITKANGALSYKLNKVKKARFKKFFKINSKDGSIRIKKKLKKGTYKLTVNVTAAGNSNYYKGTKPAVIKIVVK